MDYQPASLDLEALQKAITISNKKEEEEEYKLDHNMNSNMAEYNNINDDEYEIER